MGNIREDGQRVKIGCVREIKLSADELVAAFLGLPESETVCLLDSCGVGHLGSHLLIAGIRPVETMELRGGAQEVLETFDHKLTTSGLAGIFTISYDFGERLQEIDRTAADRTAPEEPDIFLSLFDCLIVHDYDTGQTFLTGNERRFDEIESALAGSKFASRKAVEKPVARSNFTKEEYIEAVEVIRELIRRGDTYQTNLTQQFRVELAKDLTPENVFWRLRKHHPAPFAAFIRRADSVVVSASPERFFRLDASRPSGFSGVTKHEFRPPANAGGSDRRITVSPIKGTRPRDATLTEDAALRNELLLSEKDRAENTMIVDLMRNDLGRVCKFGSVAVEKLCDLEEHPTLFHLVSTVSGELRDNAGFADVLRAVFPCGSVTGAPKIRTMQIIDKIEPADRGLSMGAIGCYLPKPVFDFSDAVFDLSVAIRTMVIRDNEAIFNVGGGIVIDSDPEAEYEESLLKAQALFAALGSGSNFSLAEARMQ